MLLNFGSRPHSVSDSIPIRIPIIIRLPVPNSDASEDRFPTEPLSDSDVSDSIPIRISVPTRLPIPNSDVSKVWF